MVSLSLDFSLFILLNRTRKHFDVCKSTVRYVISLCLYSADYIQGAWALKRSWTWFNKYWTLWFKISSSSIWENERSCYKQWVATNNELQGPQVCEINHCHVVGILEFKVGRHVPVRMSISVTIRRFQAEVLFLTKRPHFLVWTPFLNSNAIFSVETPFSNEIILN